MLKKYIYILLKQNIGIPHETEIHSQVYASIRNACVRAQKTRPRTFTAVTVQTKTTQMSIESRMDKL